MINAVLVGEGFTFKVFSREWANEQLQLANQYLIEGFLSEKQWLWPQRLAAAIMLKTELQGRGWPWQATRINNRIHYYQGKINRLRPHQGPTSEREREELSHPQEASY